MSDGGRRSYSLPARTQRGMDQQMHACVYVEVCISCCVGCACRLYIGRNSSACYEVTKCTHTVNGVEGMGGLGSDGTR